MINAHNKVEIIKVKSQKSVFAKISNNEIKSGTIVIITISLEVFNASVLDICPDNQMFGFITHFDGSSLQFFQKKFGILFGLFF